jgi:hypothetical protein
MLNYQTWLESSREIRILLAQVSVQIGGVEQTKYLSTHGVTVGGVEYEPLIKANISIDESINLDYSASISIGDIELVNTTGQLDTWLDYVWKNRSVKVYYGGLPLPGATATLTDNFELIFDGVCSDVDVKSRQSVNLKIRDKLEKLNTPVSEALIGNYYKGAVVDETVTVNQNRNTLKPKIYGEVHNISPILTDPTEQEYMVADGPVEQIIEVLDNGAPVSFTTVQQSGTPYLAPGSFRTIVPIKGACTASVQGTARTINVANSTYVDTYSPTVSNTILNLLKFAGRNLDYNEIDAASFATLGSEACGVYLNSRTNVLAVCQELAKSAGLTLAVTRTGKVKLVNIQIPTSATTTISDTDTVLNSLRIVNKPAIYGAIKLGYAKNYTIQTNLITGIPQEHKDLLAREYLEALAKDDTVIEKYDLNSEPVLEPTYLINRTQAEAAAQAKLGLFKVPRIVYAMTCTSKYLSLEIGAAVNLVSSRYGLNSGKLGLVISTKPDWLTGKIEVEVLT